jgi:hypothetical protein
MVRPEDLDFPERGCVLETRRAAEEASQSEAAQSGEPELEQLAAARVAADG